jgi:hypothetical protein
MLFILPAPVFFGLVVRGLGFVPSLFFTVLIGAFASSRMKPGMAARRRRRHHSLFRGGVRLCPRPAVRAGRPLDPTLEGCVNLVSNLALGFSTAASPTNLACLGQGEARRGLSGGGLTEKR